MRERARSFSWDAVPVTITTEDTQTSAGGAVEKEYTVPAGKKWLVMGWRATCSATKAGTVRLWKEAANTNLIEEWFNGTMTGTIDYSSRGYIVSTTHMNWVNIEIPAGATVAFTAATDAGAQTLKTQIIYKEAPV